MKLYLILFLILFVALANVFAAGDAAKGKEIYLKKCRACHAEDGAGTPPMQKKYGAKLKPLGGAEVQGMKDAAIAKGIMEGTSHKSLAKGLQPADVDSLVAHIRTLKK